MGNVGSSGRESSTRTKLKARTREQQSKARLEILTVWEDCIVKQTKYGRWLAGWRKGGKLCKVYLGSIQNNACCGDDRFVVVGSITHFWIYDMQYT
jgi:hypothetical protein